MKTLSATVSAFALIQLVAAWPATSSAQVVCARTITADVVALDQPFIYNRLGAQNPNGMMYALRRDVVNKDTGLAESEGGELSAGNVELRPDKRPRPLVLRMNAGDCLQINFTNLLDQATFIATLPEDFPTGQILGRGVPIIPYVDDQPLTRQASIHIDGLNLLDIANDGSFVGNNVSSLVDPDNSTTYTYHADHEGTHVIYSMGALLGGEGTGGSRSYGLFGAVNVQPAGSDWYRSQLTRAEMDLATPAEAFTDWKVDGEWDASLTDEFTDLNANGTWDASLTDEFIDLNANGTWDASLTDEFIDLNANGTWDASLTDEFTDLNANGTWDASLTDEFTDLNANGTWDPNESITNDWNSNGTFEANYPEPFINDWNSNGTFEANYPEPFINDWNSNGTFEANYPEPLVDTNGDGIFNAHRTTPGGQPILDYAAVYPVGTGGGKDGLPIINILNDDQIVHSDINAIIDDHGSPSSFSAYPNRDKPYREFTVIFHDAAFGVQAFPAFYNDPVLGHTLASVRDVAPINYGSAGLGSAVIANRLGVGPMWDCAECKYEEFFTASSVVGDPAMIVDIPAHSTDAVGNIIAGSKATKALYPDDPSNVHHSYLGDRVKFRNLHAGPKQHHVFNLHAHQWLFNPDDPLSSYRDSQAIGPGSGYSYEIAYGGSGNRNKTPGDAIFHCSNYTHFAGGMWSLWRVHDSFEQGTKMDIDHANGLPIPAPGSRALPDGEIVAGTPIPAVVPIPRIAMAPMPDALTTIVALDLNGDGTFDSSQFDANGDGIADIEQVANLTAAPATNPGYPFYIPTLMGHRPPTPAVDMDFDGGLPRHVVTSGPDEDNLARVGDPVEMYLSRLDVNKILHEASAIEIPENGTPTEQVAMLFHAQRFWPSFKPNGTTANFETNGLPPARGGPFADPCVDDDGTPLEQNRTLKGANIEMPIVLNKVGWHFQQQRFGALWEDVVPTLTLAKAPEPLVMRLNSNDCAEFQHTNLVPNVYQLDDYQVRTPTGVIGQHIHRVKFDVTGADGSAAGFNYEDGTFSPDEVRERIEAFNNGGGLLLTDGTVYTSLEPQAHPFFGATGPDGQNWLGARTTIQRWYADPLLDTFGADRTVGTASIEDAFSPSTQQQVGLYSTVLVEPQGSIWKDNETGVLLGTRNDGGPASWQAIIEVPPTLWTDLDGDGDLDDPSHREFYFAFADFQPAYEAGAGARITQSNENLLGDEVNIDSYADFAGAINPPFRLPPNSPDIYLHPNACPGPEAGELGLPRPCPEAISADDPGTYVLNFRNEPIGLRIFEDANLDAKLDEGEDLNGNGVLDQVIGDRGDLALAFQSRNDRVIPQLNDPAGPYPSLTFDVGPGDPWTPMMRVYLGDQVRIRTHVGAHEEEHNFTVHGLKWRSEPNSPNAGYRNSASMESYKLDIPFVADVGKSGNPNRVDYLYTIGADTEGWWNGVWGLLRSYGKLRADLQPLPNSRMTDTGLPIPNEADFDETCPVTAPVANNGQPFRVYAVRADQILGPQGLVYNDRTTSIAGPLGGVQGVGPLIDPMGIMYVLEEDLDITPGTRATPPVINGLKVGVPTEPLILRARAGDCIKVQLVNALPSTMIDANGDPTSNQNQSIGFQAQADMDGWNAVPPIIHKDESPSVLGDIVTFNFNDMQPSSYVGLHPQLVAYNIRTSDGSNVGDNDFNPNKQGKANGSLVPPGTTQKGNNQKFNDETYTWYAGDLRIDPQTGNLVSTPVEFGATALLSADKIKGSNKGSVGALIIEPEDATWTLGVGGDGRLTRAQATVTTNGATFREFVTVLQNGLNLRYGGGMCAPDPSSFDCAVPNIAAEGPLGPMEASQDSGQKAVNYRTEPLWFRLGIAPSTPFGAIIRSATLKDLIPEVFSNSLDIGDGLGPVGEPQTPVYTASPSDEVRLRVVMPGGHARGVTYTVHGHGWQRQPYIGDSTQIGDNPDSQYYGSQEGVNPSGHWDFVLEHAGGPSGVPGDYLWRDQGSFGSYQGLWGLLRVTP